MNLILKQIFNKTNDIIIGALHLPPMPGYLEFPGFEVCNKNALYDLFAFQDGGVDAVIYENNYDIPHVEFVSKEVLGMMERIGKSIKLNSKIPIGISVLWNDYKTALQIAKSLKLSFIRVPVFVDEVESRYGRINGNPQEIIQYRKSIDAENIAIFTDIHVKHSTILSKTTISEAAMLAIQSGSDGIIITGKWTGDAPDYQELKVVRDVVGDFPIIVGSGANQNNIKELLKYANAVIVSTALKKGEVQKIESDNLKSWDQRIDADKVKIFMSSF